MQQPAPSEHQQRISNHELFLVRIRVYVRILLVRIRVRIRSHAAVHTFGTYRTLNIAVDRIDGAPSDRRISIVAVQRRQLIVEFRHQLRVGSIDVRPNKIKSPISARNTVFIEFVFAAAVPAKSTEYTQSKQRFFCVRFRCNRIWTESKNATRKLHTRYIGTPRAPPYQCTT